MSQGLMTSLLGSSEENPSSQRAFASQQTGRAQLGRKISLGGYSFAVISVLLALLLRFALDPWLGDQSPYITFVVAVAVTGLYAGVRSACLATGLGAVVAYFCFVPPRYAWGFAGMSDAVGFGTYFLAAIATVLLTNSRIRAAAKAEHSLHSQIAAERKLMDTEALFRHFMDHSSACVCLHDVQGQCIYANGAAKSKYGTVANSSLGGSEQLVLGPESLEQNQKVISTGQSSQFLEKDDATGRSWLTNRFLFTDQSGQRFVGGISFEITERLRAEEILRKTECLSAAGQMASLLAHEINNPLAALSNLVFLLNEQPLPTPAREYASHAADELSRINRIAAVTLGFYFDSETPAQLQLSHMVDEVAEMFASMERFKGIRLLREYRCDATLVAPVGRIRQMIASIITNALESNPRTVRIRIRQGRSWHLPERTGVCITIADDGRGIPHEIEQKIFEPFFSTKPEKGSGLGLWAARSVVLRNNGKINLRTSTYPRTRGTTLRVFLPTPADAVQANGRSERLVAAVKKAGPKAPETAFMHARSALH